MNAYLALIATIIGVTGALGAAWAVFRTAADQKRNELNNDLITTLERALAREEQERIRAQAERDAAVNAKAILEQTVSGAGEVTKLRQHLDAQEKERRIEHAAMQTLIKDILAQLKDQRGAIGR